MEDLNKQSITLRRFVADKKFNEIKMKQSNSERSPQMRKNYPTANTIPVPALFQAGLILSLSLFGGFLSTTSLLSAGAAPRTKVFPARDANDKPIEKTDKTTEKPEKPIAKTPEPPIENVVNVNTNELVDKPHEYLNKNVKFTAKFFAFSSLALDYKPAMRPSKTHLSFLVLRPEAHVPYSELKLAMAIPKEKDPESQVLTSLKDGDQIEVIGKVFAIPMDEPWVDVLRLKKLASAPEEKKDDKKVSSSDTDSDAKASKAVPEGSMIKNQPPLKKDQSGDGKSKPESAPDEE
jgi:hypothetical protein